jgi:hypothetical protein
MNHLTKIILAAVILSLGVIYSAHTLSRFYLTLEKEKLITVKGSAQERVTSDKASISVTLSVQTDIISEGYKELAWQMADIHGRLKDAGVSSQELTENNIELNKVFKNNPEGNATNELDYYRISRSLDITSTDVQKVEAAAVSLGDLLSKNFEISITGPFYYVTGIEEAKLKLLGKATENSYKRASLMAQNSGGKVGKLVEATQGIFQITEPDSTEVTDYGTYSISTKQKDIKVVVTLKYRIE